MSQPALDNALEAIYTSLQDDNKDLDSHIMNLKKVMQAQNMASLEVDPARLPQPNRQGRKMMQSYFKQRGVIVTFGEVKA